MIIQSVIVSTLLVACGVAGRADDVSSDVDRIHRSGGSDAFFGHVSEHHWISGVGAGPRMTFHCVETEYTEYDIQQSRRAFDGERVRAAVVIADKHCIYLLGPFDDGGQSVLTDTTLLMDADVKVNDWLQVATKLGEPNSQDRVLNDAVTTTLQAEGESFVIYFAPLSARLLGIQDSAVMSMQALPTNESIRLQTMVGPLRNDNKDTVTRLVILDLVDPEEIGEPRSVKRVGLFTYRFRDRRIEGPVSKQCPWPTRVAFVHTLQELSKVGINWYDGEYDERAAKIVHESIGKPVARTEFFASLTDTFGNRDKAMDACCPFAEVRHFPVFMDPHSEAARLVGLSYTLKQQADGLLRSNGMAVCLPFNALDLRLLQTNVSISFLDWPPGNQHQQYTVHLKSVTKVEVAD